MVKPTTLAVDLKLKEEVSNPLSPSPPISCRYNIKLHGKHSTNDLKISKEG